VRVRVRANVRCRVGVGVGVRVGALGLRREVRPQPELPRCKIVVRSGSGEESK